MSISKPQKIVISRTDSIGDVILTLPLAGILKEKFPEAQIVFLGNTYTRAVIDCCEHVDEVWEWAVIKAWTYDQQVIWLKEQKVDVFLHVFPRKEIARIVKKAGITERIGTSHRAFHILSCNHRLNFTRKRSNLHEAQLNIKLLSPFGIKGAHSLKKLTSKVGFSLIPELDADFQAYIKPDRKSIILHPKSQGSAVEWGISNFMSLASALVEQQAQVFITGTEKEGVQFRDQIPKHDHIIDLSGKMSLEQLIAFIASCDALVAASTGPLHIAGVCGIKTVGLFSGRKPIHPGRWAPLGDDVCIVEDKNTSKEPQPLQIELRDVLRELTM